MLAALIHTESQGTHILFYSQHLCSCVLFFIADNSCCAREYLRAIVRVSTCARGIEIVGIEIVGIEIVGIGLLHQ